jgi:hypothetical protein
MDKIDLEVARVDPAELFAINSNLLPSLEVES